MANPSLSEYISQSQRGLYQSIFGDGMMKKDSWLYLRERLSPWISSMDLWETATF